MQTSAGSYTVFIACAYASGERKCGKYTRLRGVRENLKFDLRLDRMNSKQDFMLSGPFKERNMFFFKPRFFVVKDSERHACPRRYPPYSKNFHQ